MISSEQWLSLRTSPCSGAWAALAFPFKPRTAVLRSADLPLRRAWFCHLAVMFIFYLCAFLDRAYVHTYPWPVTARVHRGGRIGLAEAASQMLDQGGLLTFLLVPCAVEIAFLLPGVLLIAWADQPESIGQTFRRTMRVVWLSSTTWTLATLLPLGAWQWNELLRRQTAVPWPNTTTGRIIIKPDSAWILHEHNAQALINLLLVTATLWVFGGLLRALRTPTQLSCPLLPPTCESCGYNLSHIPQSGKCPECGTSADPSLMVNRRSQDSGDAVCSIRNFLLPLRISRFAGLVPKRIFASLSVLSGQRSAQRFGLFWAGVLAAIVIGIPLVVRQWGSHSKTTSDYGPWLLAIDLLPCALVASCLPLVVVSAVASVFGGWRSMVDQRNQLSAACRAAFYNTDFVAVWMAAAWLIYFFNDFPFRQLTSPSVFRMAQIIEANRPLSDRLGQVFFLLVGLAWFAYLFRRAMREMRFANR